MTNEQITQNVVDLLAYKAKSEEEHRMYESMLKRLQDNMNTFTKLAEDVHIMAISIENMQKTLEATNKKVDAMASKEFVEYKENKKLVKQNLFSAFIGAGAMFLIGIIGWLAKEFIMKGGI